MAKMTMAEIRALAAAAKETETNMTEAKKGGGKARFLPEGYSLAHITGLIQYGKQPQEFNGTKKDPADEFQLEFTLYDEGYCNEDGTPYTTRTFRIAESQFDKATSFKMFKLLNWKGETSGITTWAELIGEAIMVKFVHYMGGKDKKEKKSKIDLLGFLPPIDIRSKKPFDTPALDEDKLVCFLWDYPTIENWDALHESQQSDILGAIDFPGSELETLLLENGRETKAKKKEGAPAEDKEEDAADAPTEQVATADVSTMAMPTPE